MWCVVKRGIERAVEALTVELKQMSKPVSGNMVAQVGTISANNDETIGKIIAEREIDNLAKAIAAGGQLEPLLVELRIRTGAAR